MGSENDTRMYFGKPTIAQLAGSHLDRTFPFCRILRRLKSLDQDLLPISLRKAPDKGLIPQALLSPQLKIGMGKDKIVSCLVAQFAKHHGIESAAYGHQ